MANNCGAGDYLWTSPAAARSRAVWQLFTLALVILLSWLVTRAARRALGRLRGRATTGRTRSRRAAAFHAGGRLQHRALAACGTCVAGAARLLRITAIWRVAARRPAGDLPAQARAAPVRCSRSEPHHWSSGRCRVRRAGCWSVKGRLDAVAFRSELRASRCSTRSACSRCSVPAAAA